jgi:ribosomal protein S18 acetylase RimI-like enzyme
MGIIYATDRVVAVHEFSDLLRRSTLAERRPVDDAACLAAMLRHANLVCTAWDGDLLVGMARALTDFAYCCYLADLAVDVACQRRGIGRELIRQVQAKLGDRAKIILLAAPKAEAYYPRLGFERHGSAWTLPARATLN